MARQKSGIEKAVEALWKEQSEENWKAFAKALPKSGLKYYKVIYQKGKLTKAQDLTKSYAELYDSKQKPATKIPISMRKKGKIEGATYYMKGLLTINKADEWIK